jgi:hypothetical protein
MIDVFESYLPVQDVFGVIQGGMDRIIHFLLKIWLLILSETQQRKEEQGNDKKMLHG